MGTFSDALRKHDREAADAAAQAKTLADDKEAQIKSRELLFEEKLKTVIKPAFELFAAEMREAGRAASIEDGRDGWKQRYIDVAFFFDPNSPATPTERSAFRIKLIHSGSVEHTSFHDQRPNAKDGVVGDISSVEAITLETVNKKLLEFLTLTMESRA